MQHTDSPQDPVNQLAPKQPGAPAADDHDRMGPPSDETIRRGYELDTYDAKSVISVPLLVILFFVLAFGTVTVIFKFIAYPNADGKAHPAAAERNKRPLNARLANVGNDASAKGTREQPRLEPLKQRTGGEMARAITRPETADGNSPELHPEDLRVTKERFPELYASGGGKYGLDKVMGLNDDKLKDVFKVQQNGTKPLDSRHVPTASNAGRGAEESVATPPAAPKLEPKKDAGAPKAPEPKPGDKKPEDKKPDGKAPEPKPGDKKDGKAPEPKPGEPKPGEKK